jgi:hypothetical protein
MLASRSRLAEAVSFPTDDVCDRTKKTQHVQLASPDRSGLKQIELGCRSKDKMAIYKPGSRGEKREDANKFHRTGTGFHIKIIKRSEDVPKRCAGRSR